LIIVKIVQVGKSLSDRVIERIEWWVWAMSGQRPNMSHRVELSLIAGSQSLEAWPHHDGGEHPISIEGN